MITAFELQTFQSGQWKIDSIFDDRELVLHEAKRLSEAGRFTGVRVVEEVYNTDNDKTTTRIIFKGAKGEKENAAAHKRAAKVRSEVDAEKQIADKKKKTAQAQAAKRKKKAESNQLYVKLALKAIGLIVFGFGALIALNYLAR